MKQDKFKTNPFAIKYKAKLKKKNQKLVIPFSDEDIWELQNGEEFDWTFTTNEGEDIDILIRKEVDEDNI